MGPLGLGTRIVKPRRHVTGVAQLSDDEAAELGPSLRGSSKIAAELTTAEQVYNCLWSHVGGILVHVTPPADDPFYQAPENLRAFCPGEVLDARPIEVRMSRRRIKADAW